jgi:asparagine synthase (glutamine-hydrolysing)
MCGFAGVLTVGRPNDDVLWRMARALRHRGPDDEGVWRDETTGIGFAHARLSVVDLSASGHQPMHSPSGRHVIAYNGELYNHKDLRVRLNEKRSREGLPMIAWRGGSDTETLLAWFDAIGIEETLKLGVGMFAFAAWDREARVLTLGRDRAGEKPLFYGVQGETLLFGSELKALKAHPSFRGEIDRAALDAYRHLGYVPAPKSIYRGIHKLPQGTFLSVRAGEPAANPVVYWSMQGIAVNGLSAPFAGTDEEALGELEARLADAVGLQQVADVPTGAFLSGGIDSSLIVALMQAQSTRPVHTFTIGFQDRSFDEAPHAKAVAAHLGTTHTELYVTPDQALGVIQRLPSLYDEPFGDPSQIPTFLVSQLARKSVTVSLSGDGGDELFGGYNRYLQHSLVMKLLSCPAPVRRIVASGLTALHPHQFDRAYGVVAPMLPRRMRVRLPGDKAHKLAVVIGADSDAEVYGRLVSSWDDTTNVVLRVGAPANPGAAWCTLGRTWALEDRMMLLDAISYLPDDILCKVDRAAMGVSLETRAPFLDHRVIEFAWRLPLHMKLRGGRGKWVLRQMLHKYVPAQLIDRPKMGFGVPIGAWLRGPLREWGDALLSEDRLHAEGYFRAAAITQKWEEHKAGRRNWQYLLWSVLMFQAWLAEQ